MLLFAIQLGGSFLMKNYKIFHLFNERHDISTRRSILEVSLVVGSKPVMFLIVSNKLNIKGSGRSMFYYYTVLYN